MINSLWYPPNSTTADVRPWDTNGDLTPRAHGDYCSNTATSYGLMLAYNQLSGNTALQSAGMGGYGRKGAQRLVILETDGLANQSTTAGTTSAGAVPGLLQHRHRQQLLVELDRSQYRCDQRGQSDLCSVQRPQLWAARLFNHRQAGHHPVHCVRGDLRTDDPGERTTLTPFHCCSRSRRSAAPTFPVRPAIRPTATSGASARSPSARPSCSKPSRTILEGTVSIVLVK